MSTSHPSPPRSPPLQFKVQNMMEPFRYILTSPPPDHDNNLNCNGPGPQNMSNSSTSTSSYFPSISSVAEWSKLSTVKQQYPTYRAPTSALSALMTTPPHSPCPGLSRCSSPIDPSSELEIEELPDSYTSTDGRELLHGEIEEPSPDPPSPHRHQSPHFLEYKSDDDYEDLDLDMDLDMTSDEPATSYQYPNYEFNPNSNLKVYTSALNFPLRTHWTAPTTAIPVKQQKKRSWAESAEPSDDDYDYASDYSASSGGGRIRRRRIARDVGGLPGEAALNSRNSQVFAMEMEF